MVLYVLLSISVKLYIGLYFFSVLAILITILTNNLSNRGRQGCIMYPIIKKVSDE